MNQNYFEREKRIKWAIWLDEATEINKIIFAAQPNKNIRFVWIIIDWHGSFNAYVMRRMCLRHSSFRWIKTTHIRKLYDEDAISNRWVASLTVRSVRNAPPKTCQQISPMYRINWSNCYYVCVQWNSEKNNQLRSQLIYIYLVAWEHCEVRFACVLLLDIPEYARKLEWKEINTINFTLITPEILLSNHRSEREYLDITTSCP